MVDSSLFDAQHPAQPQCAVGCVSDSWLEDSLESSFSFKYHSQNSGLLLVVLLPLGSCAHLTVLTQLTVLRHSESGGLLVVRALARARMEVFDQPRSRLKVCRHERHYHHHHLDLFHLLSRYVLLPLSTSEILLRS